MPGVGEGEVATDESNLVARSAAYVFEQLGRTLPGLAAGAPRSFRRLAAGEMTVMAAAFALAVALSRTPLPGA